jgi:hypothetical protein
MAVDPALRERREALVIEHTVGQAVLRQVTRR